MIMQPQPESADDPASPTQIVETWRKKCYSIAGSTNDALVAVLTKGFDTMAIVTRPSATQADFDRALASLDLELINSLKFDEQKDVVVRDLTYGVMQALHAIFHLLSESGWKPAFQEGDQRLLEVKTEPPMEPQSVEKAAEEDQRSAERQEMTPVTQAVEAIEAPPKLALALAVIAEVNDEPLDDVDDSMAAPSRDEIDRSLHGQLAALGGVDKEMEKEGNQTINTQGMSPIASRSGDEIFPSTSHNSSLHIELSDEESIVMDTYDPIEEEVDEEDMKYYAMIMKDSPERSIRNEVQSSEESSEDSDSEPSMKKSRWSWKKKTRDPDWNPHRAKTPCLKIQARKSTGGMRKKVTFASVDTKMIKWRRILKKFWNAGFYTWYRTRKEEFMELDGEDDIEGIMEERFSRLSNEEKAFWMERGVERFDIKEPSLIENEDMSRFPVPRVVFEPRDSFLFTASIKERLAAFDSFFDLHRWKIDYEYPDEIENVKKERVWNEQWKRMSEEERSIYMKTGDQTIPFNQLTLATLCRDLPISFNRSPAKGGMEEDEEEADSSDGDYEMPILSRMDE